MTVSSNYHRPFGATGIVVPPIAFRADVLHSPFLPDRTKRLICIEWMNRIEPPVFIDVVHIERQDSRSNTLGRILTHLDRPADEVVINIELDPLGDPRSLAEPHPIRTQFSKACDRLGNNRLPRMVTLSPPLADDAVTTRTFNSALRNAVDSLHELKSLKTEYALSAVGIALHDWRLGQQLLDVADFDFVKLLSGPTIVRHPSEMINWLADLAARAIPIITSGVFHGGFFVGESMFDGRVVNPDAPADQARIAWRKAFTALCHGHGVRPAHACIQFALSMPGVVAASQSTSSVDRVGEVVYAATTPVPNKLWASMKEEGLLAEDYGDARSS